MKQLAHLIITSLLIGLVLAAKSSPNLAQAQGASVNESSITAIPPRLGADRSLRVKPGEKIQTSVRVRNGSSETLTLQTSAHDFIVDDNGSTPIEVNSETSNRWSLASWLVISPTVQEVAPGQIATINIIVDAPNDALPGGHYAMVTHRPNLAGASLVGSTTSAASLEQRVGTLLYVTVDGPINEAAFIRNLEVPKFSEYGPVPFEFTVDNQSDIHLSPQIGVEIYNFFGQQVDTIEVESQNIFPFIARDFTGEWDEIWGFGPYTAKVVMSYGEAGQVAIATTGFWLLPITLILAGLIVLLVLISLVIVIRRHLRHRQESQDQKIEMLEQKLKSIEQKKLQKFD